MSASKSKTILVAGDVFVDHHVYEGERHTVSATKRRGLQVIRQHGGAAGLNSLIHSVRKLTARLAMEDLAKRRAALKLVEMKLAEAQKKKVSAADISAVKKEVKVAAKKLAEWQPVAWKSRFALTTPALDSVPCGHHAVAVWKPLPKDAASKNKVWRASSLMGYGHDDAASGKPGSCPRHAPAPLKRLPQADVLVLDDAGFVFRHRDAEKCWLLPKRGGKPPEWIVLKMSGPVCAGDLWDRLVKEESRRLIVVVSAHELRQECVRLGKGLSWERTVEEMREALLSNPVLRPLATKPCHLIVTFSGDGALWLDNSGGQPKATLVYDAASAEGLWAEKIKGEAFGFLSCMVASLVRSLTAGAKELSLATAIAAGLSAMRDLRMFGHGEADKDAPEGFPVQRLASVIVSGKNEFSITRVPWTKTEWQFFTDNPERDTELRPWRIVESSQCAFGSRRLPSLTGLATQVMLQGEAAIRRLPHACFGGYLTTDRFEIETLHAIERQMSEFNRPDAKAERPLSLGVFGPPGAGKSFAVKEISKTIFGKEAWLEFNLSQFKDVDDLIGAFHQVRDKVLSGATPVVFWDEFDSREYHWLQYLLAPMQDGKFQEGQINHFIGKCVFIFAGATSSTFAEFGPDQKDAAAWNKYRLAKGPDFHSRLDAYFNVVGPNQRTLVKSGGRKYAGAEPPLDQRDVCTPLRRALFVRAKLGAGEKDRLDFDPGLLNALLTVPRYRHGARSLEKLSLSLKPKDVGEPIRRSNLPPAPVIAMHTDKGKKRGAKSFEEILDKDSTFVNSGAIERLAKAIHHAWRPSGDKSNSLNASWNKLSPAGKEDNLAAARRIPEVIALAGLELRPRKKKAARGETTLVALHIESQLERLAEAEHDGWMNHRLKNGWSYDPVRDNAKKKHHLLIPYSQLPEFEKDKDRDAVKNYIKHVGRAGFEIGFVKPPA